MKLNVKKVKISDMCAEINSNIFIITNKES